MQTELQTPNIEGAGLWGRVTEALTHDSLMSAKLELGMEIPRAFMNVVGDRSAPAKRRGEIPVIDPSDGQEFTTIARGAGEDRASGRRST